MNNSDERDHAEEQANRDLLHERDHCIRCTPTRDAFTGHEEDDVDCVHCPCCCQCLGCEYGPRDGVGMTEEQRAPAAAIAAATAGPGSEAFTPSWLCHCDAVEGPHVWRTLADGGQCAPGGQ